MSSSATILEDICEALESWSQRILDVEVKIKGVTNLREDIANSLKRQALDGLISESDTFELEYVADLWINLYKALQCKSVGAGFTDRDVLNYLLELFSLGQISKEFFIQVALQLCQAYKKNI